MVNEAKAVGRFIPSSPRKMRLVTDLVRGKQANKALEILHFQPKHAARTVEKVLRSAIANIMNLNDETRLEPEEIIISAIYVNQGPTMKRIQPAPMGRAFRVRKRACHLTITVAVNKN